MPYCNEHNEVYKGGTCPKCAGGVETDDGSAGGASGSPDVEKTISDAIQSVTDDLSADDVDGDVVIGSQNKSVDSEEMTTIDTSEQNLTEEKTVHDDSTTVTDSVVNRSDIGGDGETSVDESVVNRSSVGGDGGGTPEPGAEKRRAARAPDQGRPKGGQGGGGQPQTIFCRHCGSKMQASQETCPECSKQQ